MTHSEGINFVWPQTMPFVPWAGGSETYTLRQMAELDRQGIPAQLILHADAPPSNLDLLEGLPIQILNDKAELAALGNTVVFALEPGFDCDASGLPQRSFVLLHTPKYPGNSNLRGHTPLVSSRFMAGYWQRELKLGEQDAPPVIYPPISSEFSRVRREEPNGSVLYAGRPSVSKGVYTLFASMHRPPLRGRDYTMTCVKTINHSGGTDIIHRLYDAHPNITAVPAHSTAASMAGLLAMHDVVVMPSIWEEPFGMLSVEAQHAGCRVVTSNVGGLPETDCGGLIVVEPNNPDALACGIATALDAGPLNTEERMKAIQCFTPQDSINALRHALKL